MDTWHEKLQQSAKESFTRDGATPRELGNEYLALIQKGKGELGTSVALSTMHPSVLGLLLNSLLGAYIILANGNSHCTMEHVSTTHASHDGRISCQTQVVAETHRQPFV